MTPEHSVPAELRAGPCPVAVRTELDLGRQRLVGPSLQHPLAGVRIATGLEVPPWRNYVPLLRPGQRFSLVTAVVIRGGPVPRSLADEVHVSTHNRVRVRRPGVIDHNHLRPDDVGYDDLPLSSPVATSAECARQLSVPDLVAVGDFLVHRPRFVRDAGDRPFTSDLGWRDRRVLLEYDGDQHRTSKSQYEKDIRRYDEATATGWTVVRVRATGLCQQPRETLARIRRALSAG